MAKQFQQVEARTIADTERRDNFSTPVAGNLAPLQVHELTAREKREIREVLAEAVRVGWKSRRQLERSLNIGSIRYIVDPEKSDRGRKKVDVRYGKWVTLYNFIMGDLLREAQQQSVKQVLRKIRELHRHGLGSGRYANDLHVFNSTYLNLDPSQTVINKRYSDGCYVVFRYSSDKERLLAGLLRIKPEQQSKRYVFESIVSHGGTDRHARGTVYELKTCLTLLGFLNDGQGVEHYTLQRADANFDILHGIMTTTGSRAQPHSKQCCLIRASIIRDPHIPETVFVMPRAWDAIRGVLQQSFADTVPIELRKVGHDVDVRQYLGRDVIFFKDKPVVVRSAKSRQTGPL